MAPTCAESSDAAGPVPGASAPTAGPVLGALAPVPGALPASRRGDADPSQPSQPSQPPHWGEGSDTSGSGSSPPSWLGSGASTQASPLLAAASRRPAGCAAPSHASDLRSGAASSAQPPQLSHSQVDAAATSTSKVDAGSKVEPPPPPRHGEASGHVPFHAEGCAAAAQPPREGVLRLPATDVLSDAGSEKEAGEGEGAVEMSRAPAVKASSAAGEESSEAWSAAGEEASVASSHRPTPLQQGHEAEEEEGHEAVVGLRVDHDHSAEVSSEADLATRPAMPDAQVCRNPEP